LRPAATVRPAAVNPGRASGAACPLLEDAVEGLAGACVGEVVQEQAASLRDSDCHGELVLLTLHGPNDLDEG